MKLDLKAYTKPSEYAGIYEHNFHQIDSIQGDDFFSAFISHLSRSSGIDAEIILTDLKEYLMYNHEYQPGVLKPDIRNILILPYFILALSKGVCARKYAGADVIVDTWYSDAVRTFYTTELEEGLKDQRCLFVAFTSLVRVYPVDLLKCLAPFVLSGTHCGKIIRKHGLDLRRYVYFFFRKLLLGLAIARDIRPKLIISGNDNGFSFLIAKAAKAELMLIQNGRNSLISHFAFRYADHYVGWGDTLRMMSSGLTHHVFKHFHAFGSIRLYDRAKVYDRSEKELYDILWVSTLILKNSAWYYDVWKQWHDYDSEVAALKVFIDFCRKSRLKIAFSCRSAGELDELSKLGLYVKNIKYIRAEEQSIYTTVFQSKVILSPMSSVCAEALSLGKKVAFVNMTGNEYVNSLYKNLIMEFNQLSRITFENFIEKIMTEDIDCKDSVPQNQNYIPDLLEVVKGIIRQGRGSCAR